MKVSSSEFKKGLRGTDSILYDGLEQVAFVGRSNVGKSSVINALSNKNNLVKVSKKPGKTTEINFFLINNKFYFVDLPGYGYAKVNPEEKEKIKNLIIWYLTASNVKPHKVVLILDTKVGITPFDEQMLEILRERNHPFIIAANKIDKLSNKELAQQLQAIQKAAGDSEVVPVSAHTQHGTDPLLKRLFV